MMNRLFWGLFFVLLDLNIAVGRAVFEILPDFAGFYLLMKGMEALADRNARFEKSRHVAFGAFLLSAVLYGANLLNLEPMTKVGLWALELLCLAVFLGLQKTVVAEMGQEIRNLHVIAAVILVLNHLTGWIPLVGSICAVAAAVISVVFLLAFRKEMKQSAA